MGSNPQCRADKCISTLGVYVGGGQWMCWAHLLKCLGAAAGPIWESAPHVVLEATHG